MTTAIETVGLRKLYGTTRALDDVNLAVEEGSIFGFLGPNGAGKTTMVRLLTGLAHPSAGTVRILGSSVDAGGAIPRSLGYLPDVPGFYEWMTGEEFLDFAGRLYGLKRPVLPNRVESLLDLAGLTGVRTRIGGYSRGMRQRLGIAQALVAAPRVLVLDEPTSALDPIGRKDVLDMLLSLRGRTTVFLSTHILGDVDRVCDSVGILDHGRLVETARTDDLKARYGAHRLIVEVTEGGDGLADALRAEPWATSVSRLPNGTLEISVADMRRAQHDLPALVAARGLGLVRLETGEVQLEEVFVQLVGGEHR